MCPPRKSPFGRAVARLTQCCGNDCCTLFESLRELLVRLRSLGLRLGDLTDAQLDGIIASLDVPAPPLVGVELNPGPKNPLAALVGALAPVAVKAAVNALKGGKKKKKKNAKKRSEKSNASAAIGQAITSSRTASAPIQTGTSLRYGNARQPTRFSFDAIGVYIDQPASSSNVTFVNPATLTAAGAGVPIALTFSNQLTSAGIGLGTNGGLYQILNCYSKWRVVSLKVRYVSVMPTSTAGALAFGFTSDPGVSHATVPVPFSHVVATDSAFTTPAWGNSDWIDVTKVFRYEDDWYATDIDDTPASDATMQLASPGAIYAAQLGLAAAGGSGQRLGYLQFAGTVEVIGIRNDNTDV